MAPDPRVVKAFAAMKAIGIPKETVKPVLIDLFKLFDKKWEHIEEENYRALADAIFERQESKVAEESDRKEFIVNGSEPSLKRLRRQQGDLPRLEIPIATIHSLRGTPRNEGPVSTKASSSRNGSTAEVDGQQPQASHSVDAEDEGDCVSDLACKTGKELVLVNIPEESFSSFEIASSSLGEVKISLSYDSALVQPGFHVPNLDEVLKVVEDRCLKSYRIVEPSFSVMNLMKELCRCFLELGADSMDDKAENGRYVIPTLDSLRNSNMTSAMGSKKNLPNNFNVSLGSSSGSGDFKVFVPQISRVLAMDGLDSHDPSTRLNHKVVENSNAERGKKKNEPKDQDRGNSSSLVVFQQRQFGDVRPPHDVTDISKGEERVRISVVNEFGGEQYPPLFYYIPQNIVYQSAYVKFSLARIGDEDCCSSCFGDCLSSSIPCACARETGGEFAYTLEGRVKEGFLNECISMNRDPDKHPRHDFCKDCCPLERSKNDDLADPCKGHLLRKFIKECWSKCGCNKQCGNRVVQRGITCNLQVFMSPEGKGWGVRTLEVLPKGTFVCEYAGEIVTNIEQYERNMRSSGKEKHTYPVLLDADWGSERILNDEECLCLDATFYGNVARFVNHRCFDANMIGIPVEVETPDRHYYHLAFFTTRNIDALEELNWDYGIDFDDHNHPVKAFRCCCGSKFCRDMKRSNRGKSPVLW